MRNIACVALFAIAMMVAGSLFRRWRRGQRTRRAEADPAPAPVVPAGPVRRLLRGARQGLLPRGRLRRHDPARARSRSCPRRSSPAARPSSGSAGCRACSRRANPAPTASSSPRSSSARRRCRSRSRTRTSPRPRTSPARRSARGASATRPSCTRACARPGWTRTTPSDVSIVAQQFDMVAFVGGRDRRRTGDDLQRVRAGPRDDQPGHR